MQDEAIGQLLQHQAMLGIETDGVQGGRAQRQSRDALGRDRLTIAQAAQQAQDGARPGAVALAPVTEILSRQRGEMESPHAPGN